MTKGYQKQTERKKMIVGKKIVGIEPVGTRARGRPMSLVCPNYKDQFEIFNKFEYKPMLLKEEAVKTKAKSKQELTLEFTIYLSLFTT
jgi:hypothetical protein